MKSLYPQLRLTDSNFNYTPAAKTDIRDTFRRFTTGGLQNNKPLVSDGGDSLMKPLVASNLAPNQFVLSSEEMDFQG